MVDSFPAYIHRVSGCCTSKTKARLANGNSAMILTHLITYAPSKLLVVCMQKAVRANHGLTIFFLMIKMKLLGS